MERRPRRYWTWVVTTGATLVIVAAAASSLFQVAVQSVPGYRAEVEQYVRQLTGRPVRIDALGLSWHYYYPMLDLIGIALLADDNETVVLQAERLRLGFGLTDLVRGNYMPDRLALYGFAVDARIDSAGHVNVKGIDSAGARDAPLEALRPLTQFGQLRLERCRLNLRDERGHGEIYSFGIQHAELDRGLLGDALEADVTLPASIGDAAHFEGSFTGEPLEPATWSGSGALELSGLMPAAWLQPWLARGTRLDMTGVEGRVSGSVEQGHLKQLEFAVKTGVVHAHRARFDAGFDELDARVAVELLADGWKAELKKFSLQSARGAWPSTQGELRATTAAGSLTAYDAQLSYADLSDLAPWLRLLQVPEVLAQLDQASGVVRDAQFRVQGSSADARYSYRARFETLSLPAGDHDAGFSGLSGELAGDEGGGRAMLQEGPLTLDLPGLLVSPSVPLEAFEGELEWSEHDGGWQIRLPQFRWALLSTRGSGHFSLDLPGGDRTPVIDLAAQFVADDVTRAKPLMPLHWSAGLRGWLERSIVSGRATRAQVVIKGPLADFPFQEHPTGVFNLDIDARNVLLAYQPDWPSIEGIDAALTFHGDSLSIAATRGSILGNPISSATAKFPDFRTGQLLIDGSVAGETARFYDFLRQSPLREKFEGLLAQTQATGPSTVDIHLDMPVSHPADTRIGGRVTAEGVELRHASLPEPIREIRGQIGFTGTGGITAEKVTGRLYELPIEGSLTPQSADVSHLTAGFRLAIDPQGKGASQLIPAWLRKKVAGASNWRADLLIGGALASGVTLTTDLVGVEVKYPPPIGKPPSLPVPLTLVIGSLPGTPLRITADYKDRFGADLHFSRPHDDVALERAALRAGGGATPPAEEKGIVLGGDVAELDLRAWAGELTGAGMGEHVHLFKRANLHVGKAAWDRYALRDVRYQWTGQPGGWTLTLAGPGGAGELHWTDADRGVLSAKLDALVLDYAPPPADELPDPGVLDPNKEPLYDLDVRKFTLNQANLGHVAFATGRTELGQSIRTLKIGGGTVTAALNGEWRRRAGQSSASLNGDFATTDIASLLRAFGYAPNLDAKAARIKTALTWAPTDRGLEWHAAQGTVHLEFENGQLRAVEPGAGRVLGLINFFALPRRLSLNFRDVVSSGLGFDRIDGDFELRDGNAHTQNLRVAGPSLRMDMSGRIGLAARDYDQQVTVYPDVSSGVTIGALLLGGPVAGALALIAQQVLKKPLNQVTHLSYRVTGSWDNPQVERATAPPPPPVPAVAPSRKP